MILQHIMWKPPSKPHPHLTLQPTMVVIGSLVVDAPPFVGEYEVVGDEYVSNHHHHRNLSIDLVGICRLSLPVHTLQQLQLNMTILSAHDAACVRH